jgi:hypothetical protein
MSGQILDRRRAVDASHRKSLTGTPSGPADLTVFYDSAFPLRRSGIGLYRNRRGAERVAESVEWPGLWLLMPRNLNRLSELYHDSRSGLTLRECQIPQAIKERVVAAQNSGSGQVKHPESDKRLKENQSSSSTSGRKSDSGMKDGKAGKDSGQNEPDRDEDGKFVKSAGSKVSKDDDKRSSGHTPGAVADPEHDGRLKENRDKGSKKSDAR